MLRLFWIYLIFESPNQSSKIISDRVREPGEVVLLCLTTIWINKSGGVVERVLVLIEGLGICRIWGSGIHTSESALRRRVVPGQEVIQIRLIIPFLLGELLADLDIYSIFFTSLGTTFSKTL